MGVKVDDSYASAATMSASVQTNTESKEINPKEQPQATGVVVEHDSAQEVAVDVKEDAPVRTKEVRSVFICKHTTTPWLLYISMETFFHT